MNKIYFIVWIAAMLIPIGYSGYMAATTPPRDPNLKKVEQGLMSKVNYEGHSYIVWSINFGGGLTHDPDCLCIKGGK